MGLKDMSNNEEDESSTERRYVVVTREEFEEFLEELEWNFQASAGPHSTEIVYESHDIIPDENGVVLRIYSTISKSTGKARSKGADAIRTVIADRHSNRPIGGRKKTLRISTWRKNLREKIESVAEQYEQHIQRCPECGSGWLVEKEGKYGPFLGCTNYPECDHTEDP